MLLKEKGGRNRTEEEKPPGLMQILTCCERKCQEAKLGRESLPSSYLPGKVWDNTVENLTACQFCLLRAEGAGPDTLIGLGPWLGAAWEEGGVG